MECLSCGNSTDSIFTACPRCGAKHIRAYSIIVSVNESKFRKLCAQNKWAFSLKDYCEALEMVQGDCNFGDITKLSEYISSKVGSGHGILGTPQFVFTDILNYACHFRVEESHSLDHLDPPKKTTRFESIKNIFRRRKQ